MTRFVYAPEGVVVHYPFTAAQMRQQYNISIRDNAPLERFEEIGMFPVVETAKPADHPSVVISEGTPIFLGNTWTQVWDVVDAPAPTTEQLIEYTKRIRKQKERGGITIAGVPIETDELSQMKIIGARVAADANPEWTTVWSGADGGSYPINAVAMIAISNAVQEHVNWCFMRYAEIIAGINNSSITTYTGVEEAFDAI